MSSGSAIQTMRELRRADNEAELRRRAGAGDRCAAITLFKILVDADRLDELPAMQEAGDDRAGTTLMEALTLGGAGTSRSPEGSRD